MINLILLIVSIPTLKLLACSIKNITNIQLYQYLLALWLIHDRQMGLRAIDLRGKRVLPLPLLGKGWKSFGDSDK
jgi:hypothetical protein